MPTFYLSFERAVSGVDPTSFYWRALSNRDNELTRIAESLHVQPILEFFSMPEEELAQFLEAESVDAKATPAEAWFLADDGSKTISALLAHLRTHHDLFEDQEKAVSELEEFSDALMKLKLQNTRFHVSIDY